MANIHQRDFNSCPHNVQSVLCKYNGTFLARRLESRYMVTLHFVAYYYVELWKDRKSQEVLYSKTFLDSSDLDPYLEFIDISELTDLD